MQEQLNKFLNLDLDDDSLWLKSIHTLRKLIGILGMALPFILVLFLFLDTGHTNSLESISHYYYTRANSAFIIVMSLLAIFLMIYKYKNASDFYISFIAGFFALMVIIFPTSNITDVCCDLDKAYSVTFLKDTSIRINFHYFSAAIFLLCLTYMSLFLFTKSNKLKKQRTKQKQKRNTVYIVCGVLMSIALLVIVLGLTEVIPEDIYAKNHLTFWMEVVAVECFGISWLVKGKGMLRDK